MASPPTETRGGAFYTPRAICCSQTSESRALYVAVLGPTCFGDTVCLAVPEPLPSWEPEIYSAIDSNAARRAVAMNEGDREALRSIILANTIVRSDRCWEWVGQRNEKRGTGILLYFG